MPWLLSGKDLRVFFCFGQCGAKLRFGQGRDQPAPLVKRRPSDIGHAVLRDNEAHMIARGDDARAFVERRKPGWAPQ